MALGDANALAIRWYFQREPEVRDRIREALHDRIVRMAGNYARRCRGQADKDDLYQSGTIGVTKSLQAFHPERGDYEPYAMRFIRGEMLHFIRDSSLTIKIPGSVKEAGGKITRFQLRFAEDHGRPPSVHEISEALSMSLDRTTHCMSITLRQKSCEPLSDHHSAQAEIDGSALGEREEESEAMRIYNAALAMRASGASTGALAEHFQIDREQATALAMHLDAEMSR